MLTDDAIQAVVDEVIAARHFIVAPPLSAAWSFLPEETVPWEIFRGRLLDPAHCLEERSFRSWHVHLSADPKGCPTISIHSDAADKQIFVVRALLSYVWEGYDSGANVILSREVTKWVRELIAAISLEDFSSIDELRDELACQLFLAVVGTSRLPLTSTEAPLPAFSLGQLGYFFSGTDSSSDLHGEVSSACSWRELAKWLELTLRREPQELIANVALFVARWRQLGRTTGEIPALMRTLFNDVSLSPYTCFVDNALAFLRELVQKGYVTGAEHVDVLGWILRQLGRHLTAYDLITFHHRGANYPDALLLDAVLREYVTQIEAQPALFAGADSSGRSRRRALRQACLLRQYYVGHLVPDAPTSPGENARVLPEPHRRVPEEQFLQSTSRTRQLFADQPLSSVLSGAGLEVVRQSIVDLNHSLELRELGMAVFIDRPLGFAKLPGEPDQTPLLAHEAFSRSIAVRRLRELPMIAKTLDIDNDVDWDAHARELDKPVVGMLVRDIWAPDRPTVSLADVKRVADDFMLLRTMPGSLRQLVGVHALACLSATLKRELQLGKGLIAPIRKGVLGVFDLEMRKRWEMEIDSDGGYRSRGGIECPSRIYAASFD